MISLPLGKYENFKACVADNRNKRDPEAYCGSIEHAVNDGLSWSDATAFADAAEFTPPESGNLPSHGKTILARAYSACRSSNPGYSKERCSKIAWGAVENAGYRKSGEKWTLDSATGFAWLGEVRPMLGDRKLVQIETPHSICTLNKHCYDWEEIMYGFASLIGRPVDFVPNARPGTEEGHGNVFADFGHPQVVGQVLMARPDPISRSGQSVAEVKPEIWQMVKDGKITSASVVSVGLKEDVKPDGRHIRYPIFTRIALLERNQIPGDVHAWIKAVETAYGSPAATLHSHRAVVLATATSNAFGGADSFNWGNSTLTKLVKKTISGEAGKPSDSEGSPAGITFEDMHFIASKVTGPIREAPLSYKDRMALSEKSFADTKNRVYPHHRADATIDLPRLEASRRLAVQRGASADVLEHLERHAKELKLDEFATPEAGIPAGDGRWIPEGFVVRGARSYPENMEAWNSFKKSWDEAIRFLAFQETLEEQVGSIANSVEQASTTVQTTAGFVSGGNLVSVKDLNACKAQFESFVRDELKKYIRSENMPVLVKESVALRNLDLLEGAARFLEAFQIIKPRMPQFVVPIGGQVQMVSVYRRGFEDAKDQTAKLLKEMGIETKR